MASLTHASRRRRIIAAGLLAGGLSMSAAADRSWRDLGGVRLAPGCESTVCADTICLLDPFCCDALWDPACSDLALSICTDGQVTCEQPGPLTRTGTPLDTIRSEPEMWFNFVAPETGTVRLAASGGPAADTELEVYRGCDPTVCPPAPDDLVGVNDDCAHCGDFSSFLELPVIAGHCYKIRLGVWFDEADAMTDPALTVRYREAQTADDDLIDRGCANGEGRCDEAKATPGCEDAECCRAVCAIDPFCCETEWDANCAALAATACTDGCRVEIELDDIREIETNGDDLNGSCQAAPQTVQLGDAFFGSAWAQNGARDTDWWRFTLDEATTIRLWAGAEFPAVIYVIGGVDQCVPQILRTTGGAADCAGGDTAELHLGPGEYAIFVAPAAYEGVPMRGSTGNHYRIELNVVDD